MSFKIEFQRSGKTIEWDDSAGNILELAEENGIEIESACREGYCGTCKVKLISGQVEMESTEGLEEDEEGYMILPCVAVPITDIVIDA